MANSGARRRRANVLVADSLVDPFVVGDGVFGTLVTCAIPGGKGYSVNVELIEGV